MRPQAPGKWKLEGSGWSKHVFSHPDQPGYVFKFSRYCGWDDYDIRNHYYNLQQLMQFTDRYPEIKLPFSCLIQGNEERGTFLIEERISFTPKRCPYSERIHARLDAFLQESKLRDIDLDDQHNAGFLPSCDKIGIIDFDHLK